VSELPAWLEPLPDAATQRAIDQWAIEEAGVPALELMERAGEGLARLVAERVPEGRIAVLCGRGNNGGDGLVVARLLREDGRDVDVLAVGDLDGLQGSALENLRRLPGAPAHPWSEAELSYASAIVDAMLGTGFAGEPREPVAGAIDAINRAAAAGATVIAADVPSGVDASSGEVHGAAVRADATVTFHAAKPGLWISPGKEHAGDVVVAGIGVPRGAPGAPDVGLIDAAVLGEVPRRDAASTKFAGGSVLVCGGSRGLTGAPSLSAEAAMRAGAGYVTAAVPASVHHVFELRLLEVMTVPLDADESGALGPGAVAEVLDRAGQVGALVLGPGAGRAPATQEAARAIAAGATVPLLVDADGLNAHAGRLGELRARGAATVLTPHAGELGRLLERTSEEIGRTRLACVREAAERAHAVVVLKGDDTLVAAPGGRVAVSRGGSPALATAGTGDVLSGVIGAFLAKGLDPFTAAAAGVFVHSRAGQLAPGDHGPDGVIASDVVAALPRALTR
jgi:NAD(P)H-hydrate epimerase